MNINYKGLKASYKPAVVSEEEIQEQLEIIKQQNATQEKVTDRKTDYGDTVILDYSGYVGDKQFEGGTATNQSLVLGSGMFIPGFEEQLVDKEIGEDVEVKVTFPEGYHADELSGAEAVFKCKIHEIIVTKPAEITDEFVKEVYHYENVEAFIEGLRKNYTDYIEQNNMNQVKDELLGQIMAQCEYTPDEEELEKETENQLALMKDQLAQSGLTIEKYCEYTGNTVESMKDTIRPNAVNTLKSRAIVMEIARLENIKPDAMDIDAECSGIRQQYGISMEEFMKYYDADFAKRVRENVMMRKAMDRVVELAELTPVEE